MRAFSPHKKYSPLDELLETMSVRVMRALRWFDWVSLHDLIVAMEAGDDLQTRNAISQNLTRCGRLGLVESRPMRTDRRQYRITPLGKRWLVWRLETDSRVAP